MYRDKQRDSAQYKRKWLRLLYQKQQLDAVNEPLSYKEQFTKQSFELN